jgi:hypothetical protein
VIVGLKNLGKFLQKIKEKWEKLNDKNGADIEKREEEL